MSRKIAISIDGSSHADRAFEWALENLVRAGDEVHLLHILESKEVSLHNPKFTSGLCMPFDEWQKVVEEAYANARELLAPYVARVKKRSLACEMQVKPGVPSDGAAIVDIAESRLHANSIVMGTRGRGKVGFETHHLSNVDSCLFVCSFIERFSAVLRTTFSTTQPFLLLLSESPRLIQRRLSYNSY